jgi:serine/threonine-protein kinase
MITGQLPFKGDYDQAIMYAITNEALEPVSALRTGVPLELERIINRMLAKDPRDRYQHMDDLLSELNRLKREADLQKKVLPITSEKNKKSVIFILAIILSIVVLMIAGYFLLRPSQTEKEELIASEWENSIAVLPFVNLSGDPEQESFCYGMTVR